MHPTRTVNMDLLAEIDKTTLDEDRLRWREDIKQAPYKIHTDRQKYATESWKETVGEDLEIRRAKLFRKIADNLAIDILDYDHIVGRIFDFVR